MFHDIPQPILERMAQLEAWDARDRQDGTPRRERLRQVPPDTGRFLALMAASAPEGEFLEIGTSAGYSTLWISLALRARSVKLHTFEMLPAKIELARETFQLAEIEHKIKLIADDALSYLPNYKRIAFCFLDAEKEIYRECYDLVVANLVPGGLLLADNVISHAYELEAFVSYALEDRQIDAVVIPIAMGVLFCRSP